MLGKELGFSLVVVVVAAAAAAAAAAALLVSKWDVLSRAVQTISGYFC